MKLKSSCDHINEKLACEFCLLWFRPSEFRNNSVKSQDKINNPQIKLSGLTCSFPINKGGKNDRTFGGLGVRQKVQALLVDFILVLRSGQAGIRTKRSRAVSGRCRAAARAQPQPARRWCRSATWRPRAAAPPALLSSGTARHSGKAGALLEARRCPAYRNMSRGYLSARTGRWTDLTLTFTHRMTPPHVFYST